MVSGGGRTGRGGSLIVVSRLLGLKTCLARLRNVSRGFVLCV